MSMAHEWPPCTWRVNAELDSSSAFTRWKHGCFLAEYLIWSVQWMSTSIYFSSFCLLFFSVLRHLQPAVQLLFVSQLARQLAKQLDCERGCCQPPVFEASVPLSDFQLEKLPVPEKLKSLCFSFSLLRMQGVQCLEQYLKKHGTQEILEFSDGILHPLISVSNQ